MVNQMGTNHPYIKYFKLIAEKLNIQPEPTPTISTNNLSNISVNKLSQNDDDTDEED